MIATSSRYAASTIVVGNDLAGDDIQIIVPSIQGAYSFSFAYYQLIQFDTLPDIAYENYGDPTLWWVIADANPEILLWDSVTAGTIIRIPVSASA
jgi:hypothetical protein